jgi:hypothetical protein
MYVESALRSLHRAQRKSKGIIDIGIVDIGIVDIGPTDIGRRKWCREKVKS